MSFIHNNNNKQVANKQNVYNHQLQPLQPRVYPSLKLRTDDNTNGNERYRGTNQCAGTQCVQCSQSFVTVRRTGRTARTVFGTTSVFLIKIKGNPYVFVAPYERLFLSLIAVYDGHSNCRNRHELFCSPNHVHENEQSH